MTIEETELFPQALMKSIKKRRRNKNKVGFQDNNNNINDEEFEDNENNNNNNENNYEPNKGVKEGIERSFLEDHLNSSTYKEELKSGAPSPQVKNLMELYYSTMQSELYLWKEFPIQLPHSSIIENDLIVSNTNLFKDEVAMNELVDVATSPIDGRQKKLGDEALEQLRVKGYFEIPSNRFVGKKHRWQVSPFIFKGIEPTSRENNFRLSFAYWNIRYAPLDRLLSCNFGVKGGLKYIKRTFVDLLKGTIGLPETQPANNHERLNEEKLKFFLGPFYDQLKIATKKFLREKVASIKKNHNDIGGIVNLKAIAWHELGILTIDKISDLNQQPIGVDEIDLRLIEPNVHRVVSEHISTITSNLNITWGASNNDFIESVISEIELHTPEDVINRYVIWRTRRHTRYLLFNLLLSFFEKHFLGKKMGEYIIKNSVITAMIEIIANEWNYTMNAAEKHFADIIKEAHPIKSNCYEYLQSQQQAMVRAHFEIPAGMETSTYFLLVKYVDLFQLIGEEIDLRVFSPLAQVDPEYNLNDIINRTISDRKNLWVEIDTHNVYDYYYQQNPLLPPGITIDGEFCRVKADFGLDFRSEIYMLKKQFEWDVRQRTLVVDHLTATDRRPSRVYCWRRTIWDPKNYILEKPKHSHAYILKKYTEHSVDSSSYFWRLKNIFVRSSVWVSNNFYRTYQSAVNGSWGVKCLLYFNNYYQEVKVVPKTGEIIPDPYSERKPMIHRVKQLFKSIKQSREAFEKTPDNGILGKGITRLANLIWNYLLVLPAGLIYNLGIFPIGCVLNITISLLLLLSTILIMPIFAVLKYLFTLLIYDEETCFSSPRFFPLLNTLLLNFGIKGILQSVLAFVSSFTFHPLLSLLLFLLSYIIFCCSRVCDFVVFRLVLRRLARVPISNSIVARRISGPGLSRSYYYQISPDNVIIRLLIELESTQLQHFRSTMVREIRRPIDDANHFLLQVLGHSFDIPIITSNVRKFEKRLANRCNARQKQLPNCGLDLNKVIRQTAADLEETTRRSRDLVYDFVTKEIFERVFSSDDSKIAEFWDRLSIDRGNWEELTRHYLSTIFGTLFLEPLLEDDDTVVLDVESDRASRISNFLHMISSGDIRDDLQKFRVSLRHTVRSRYLKNFSLLEINTTSNPSFSDYESFQMLPSNHFSEDEDEDEADTVDDEL